MTLRSPFSWKPLRTRAAATLLAGLLAVLAVPSRALALTPQQKQEMRQHYDRASRAYDVGKFSEAIDEYQKVYEIGGNVAMLYNIAQSYRLDNQPSEALRYYRRYLERAPNASNREDIERKMADLEKTIAVTAPPPPAPAPPPVIVPPPYVAPPAAPPPAAPPTPSGTFAAWASRQPWPAYGLVAAGAAGLIVAVVEGGIASDKADKLSAASKQGQPFDPAVQSNGQRADAVAITAGIVGAAALAAGGALLYLHWSSHRHSETPAPTTAFRNVTPVVTPVFAPTAGGGVLGAGAAWSF